MTRVSKYMRLSKTVARPIKVVQLSLCDYGGSGYKIARAIERVNPLIEVSCYVGQTSRARRRFKHPSGEMITTENHERVQQEVMEADILHFKGDDLPGNTFCGIYIPFDTPALITVSGSGFRRGNSNAARAWTPIQDYVKRFDHRTTITPDLNYPEFRGRYIPQPIDSRVIPFVYDPFKCKYCHQDLALTIAHSPSARGKKGTDSIIIPVIKKLIGEGYGDSFVFDLIVNVTNKECIKRKRNAAIFIDQINKSGAYGNNGLEAMQYGIPTIASISDQAIKQSEGIWDNTPVMVCRNRAELYETLKGLLDRPKQLTAIARRTKMYCDRVHSYESVGREYERIFYEMLND